MEKLVKHLMRLYLMPGMLAPELLTGRIHGLETQPVSLANLEGMTRAIVIPFDPIKHDDEGAHWTRLCECAHVLQTAYGFPAPAVSISSGSGYRLWLSLAAPVASADATRFVRLLWSSCFPELAQPGADLQGAIDLAPCRDAGSGRWSAFINPGMGASFVGEPGLEMAPPSSAQAAFLEQLESIEPAEFAAAMATLQAALPQAAATAAPRSAPASTAPGELLLRDATLEDIVRHLHALHIEPTFRHLLP